MDQIAELSERGFDEHGEAPSCYSGFAGPDGRSIESSGYIRVLRRGSATDVYRRYFFECEARDWNGPRWFEFNGDECDPVPNAMPFATALESDLKTIIIPALEQLSKLSAEASIENLEQKGDGKGSYWVYRSDYDRGRKIWSQMVARARGERRRRS